MPGISLYGASASDKVQDERDDREEQKQVNEEARGVEQKKSAEPQDNQNNCKNQKHGSALSLPQRDGVRCRTLQPIV
jgi:hypothetical protein